MNAVEERFWSHVDRGAENDCWLWRDATRKGYGTFKLSPGDLDSDRRRDVFAHRVAFYLENGRWPTPVGRHTCDVPRCCNPAHIVEGTWKQNMDDKYARGRANHPRGVRSARAALSVSSVREIQVLSDQRVPQRVIASRLGVSQATVSRVASGVRYS